MNIAQHHPRMYHLQPDEYPHGLNYLDLIPAYDPAEITDYEPSHKQRWSNILAYMEAQLRADKARLKADRDAVGGTDKLSAE